jgi:hypothetical protein
LEENLTSERVHLAVLVNADEIRATTRGGETAGLTRRPASKRLKTTDRVIGIYATDNWAHSTFGRKIEKAVTTRHEVRPIAIVGEQHWVGQLRS